MTGQTPHTYSQEQQLHHLRRSLTNHRPDPEQINRIPAGAAAVGARVAGRVGPPVRRRADQLRSAISELADRLYAA